MMTLLGSPILSISQVHGAACRVRRVIRIFAVLLIAAALPSCGTAAERPIVPSRLAEALVNAHPGDTITLAPGDYGDVTLPRVDNRPAITVDASQARLRSLTIRQTAGWNWRGGVISGGDANGKNVIIDGAKRVEVADTRLKDGVAGVTVTRGSEDIVLRKNVATGMIKDGFDLNDSARIRVIGNSCADFRPILAEYDAKGVKIKDGTHNDCFQLWATPGNVLEDVEIVGNIMRGYMQGIGQYSTRVQNGVTRRISVRDNDVEISFWNGISFDHQIEGMDVRGNNVRTIPGAMQGGIKRIHARIVLHPDAVRCGNVVDGVADGVCQ